MFNFRITYCMLQLVNNIVFATSEAVFSPTFTARNNCRSILELRENYNKM